MTRDATDELRRALSAGFKGFEGSILFEPLTRRDWTSITFSGERHRVRLQLAGERAQDAADAFIAGLAEREFRLRGHLLADLALIECRRASSGVSLILDALTVEDG